MAKKKEEEVKKGLDEWMGTFSDMMTLLMCFFVMLFAMSSIDAAKFEEAAQSFQQTVSIFKGGAKAIGDGILVSNGVSQLNQLDEFFNTTGKVATSDSDEMEFQENAQAMKEATEKLDISKEELEKLLEMLEALEKQGKTAADLEAAQGKQDMAEALEMSEAELKALLEMLGMTEEELKELLGKLEKFVEEAEASEMMQNNQSVAKDLGLTQEELMELLEKLGMTEAELDKMLSEMEEEKMKQSEEMAEKIEEALAEGMLQEKIDVEFNANCVILSLSGAFLFDSGQAKLKSEAVPILNKVGVILAKYANHMVEIEGHTDSVPLNGGRYENNDVLSSYRALAVFNYLKDNAAIDPGVMKHAGRGEYVPVADNSTPEGRAKNRRVEIKIYNALSAY